MEATWRVADWHTSGYPVYLQVTDVSLKIASNVQEQCVGTLEVILTFDPIIKITTCSSCDFKV